MTAEAIIIAAMMSNPAYIPKIEYVEQVAVEEAEETTISEEELDLLSRLISAECGAEWCEDKMLYYTGSVVLNRISSEYYPSTMYEVIYQPGQYSVTWSGSINSPPTERSVRIAEELLTSGSVLPSEVLYQANFLQGSELYEQIQTMYFCVR